MSENQNVYNACCRLFYELSINQHLSNPYALPYTNYIMSWHRHIPINTIIIGQNPYPQDIYPDIGSAFSFDKCKTRGIPATVRNLAYDVNNYDNTSFDDAVECFANSWKLLEVGVIFINETVFDKLLTVTSNTRRIKEMEAQIKALQIVMTESYLMGQKLITCIGMGMPAAKMTSIIRSWYPKDLFQVKIITCKNPAARDIGDLLSHQVTIGKTVVSKILSEIVKLYIEMPPKVDHNQKRRQQNIDSLKKGSDEVSVTADAYINEVASFEDRLRSIESTESGSVTLESILASSASLRNAIDKHRNAIAAHNIRLLMVVESIPKYIGENSTLQSTTPSTPSIQTPVVQRTGGARRRITKPVQFTETVPETPEPEPVQQDITPSVPPSIAESGTPSTRPTRARRRVSSRPSYAQSEAPTEYTTDIPLANKSHEDMSAAESVSMKSFVEWCTTNIPDDPTYSEILNVSADDKIASSELSKSVLSYIRSRKSQNTMYDAYEELIDVDSQSSQWAKTNIMPAK